MKMFTICIIVGLLLMITGAVIAIPPSASISRIWTGALFCWTSLPFFWLAGW